MSRPISSAAAAAAAAAVAAAVVGDFIDAVWNIGVGAYLGLFEFYVVQ